jgi:hypothetical protein
MSDLARCRTKNKYHRRKSVRSESDALGVELGTIGPEDSVLDAAEDKLWFPIGNFLNDQYRYCEKKIKK